MYGCKIVVHKLRAFFLEHPVEETQKQYICESIQCSTAHTHLVLQISNLSNRKLQINCYHRKCLFQLKMHQKPFGDHALPGRTDELTVLLRPLVGLRVWGPQKGEGRRIGEWGKGKIERGKERGRREGVGSLPPLK